MSKRTKTGVAEWAGKSFNFQIGCENGCLYCYAKKSRLQYGVIKKETEWGNPTPHFPKSSANLLKSKIPHVIMFPTTHDITEQNLAHAIHYLRSLLSLGQKILLVTKARYNCIKEICKETRDWKDGLEVRVTVGSADSRILKAWEPNAPDYVERMAAFTLAKCKGFKVSVSMEPMLDLDPRTVIHRAVNEAESIWLGFMNRYAVNRKSDLGSIVPFHGNVDFLKELMRLKDIYGDKTHFKDSVRKALERAGL